MQQCTELIAKIDCQLNTSKGRPWIVRAGQKFWVTSATYNNAEGCKIDRKGKGSANSGIYLTNDQLEQCLMFNFCKHCDCKLWSSYSKQTGECPECNQPDNELEDLEDELDKLLSYTNEMK